MREREREGCMGAVVHAPKFDSSKEYTLVTSNAQFLLTLNIYNFWMCTGKIPFSFSLTMLPICINAKARQSEFSKNKQVINGTKQKQWKCFTNTRKKNVLR